MPKFIAMIKISWKVSPQPSRRNMLERKTKPGSTIHALSSTYSQRSLL